MRHVCQTKKGSRKNKPNHTKNLKYGIEATHNVVRTKDIDDANGGALWKYETKKEVDTLMYLDHFEFNPEGYKMGEG